MTGIRSSFVLLAMLALQAVGSAQATTSPAAPNRRPIVLAVDQTTPQPAGDAAVRKRAEDLATQATGRFSEILSKDEDQRSAEVFAPLWSWLSRAQSDYRDVIVTKLKSPSGEIVVIAPPGSNKLAQAAGTPEAPRTEPEPQRVLNWPTIVEGVANWLAQTNSSYRNEIVKKLERPVPGAPAVAGGEAPEAQSPAATRGMSPQPEVAAAPQPMAGAAPAPSPAPSSAPAIDAAGATAPETQRTGDAAEQAAEDAAAKSRAEEIRRIADAEDGKRRAAEERRLTEAETQRKAAADKAEASRRADAEAAEERAEEAEAEAERKAEAKRRADAAEAKRKAAEAKREAAAAAAKRRAEEAEAERQAEAKRAADAAEAKRKAAEAKSAAEAAEVAEVKHKAEEKKRLIEEAEAERKAVDDAQRLAQAETKSAPEAGPAKIPAADTPTKQPEPPARDDTRQAADVSSEPAQSAPVAPKAERRKARPANPHKKRAQKTRRKVYAAQGGHYRSGRKARRKVHRTRRYRIERASGGEDARVYVVRRGDTLSAIARRYYGTGSGYHAIYKANRGRIRNPHLIYPRQRIYIPQRRRRW